MKTRNVLAIVAVAGVMAGCASVESGGVPAVPTSRPFGTTATGCEARLYTLQGAGGLKLEVSDFGGRLVRCWAPDRKGVLADVTLGWNSVSEYEKNGFCVGTLIGRVGNRIRDGRFSLDGREWRLAINETSPAPRHCNLHSGPVGWDAKVWRARAFAERDAASKPVPGLELTLVSPDGDMGFPGTVTCVVTYRVLPDNTWSVDYQATTDRPTVVNPTHHSYWNLAGEASGNVLGQELQIFADQYMKTDAGLIPTATASVKGTGFDFTERRAIGARSGWMSACAEIACTDNWYDHNFVLRGKTGEMKPAATMYDPASGRKMEVWTTEPCLQMYGAQNMDGTLNAKAAGKKLPQYAGLALETQHAPDSPNHPEWPTVVLKPGETFRSTTEYRFTAE